MLPPSPSITSTIARAERSPAPLNTMCSRRCDQPERASSSARAPRPATTERATVCSPGMGSQTTRTPLASVWIFGVMASGPCKLAHEGLDGVGVGVEPVEALGSTGQVSGAAGQVGRDATGLGHVLREL